MGKWTDAAKTLRSELDARKGKADDMDILIAGLAQLPPGQLKKVLTDDVIALLEKYGINLNEE